MSLLKKVTCEHKFVFIRQEEKNIGYDRNPTWLIEDLFFCEKCLLYKRVAISKRHPRSDGNDYIEKFV